MCMRVNIPGWCGDDGGGELVIQKRPKHKEMTTMHGNDRSSVNERTSCMPLWECRGGGTTWAQSGPRHGSAQQIAGHFLNYK